MDKETAQIKKALFGLLMKKDPGFSKEENIIFAENAFLINSVLSWYLKDHKISSQSVTNIMKILEKHIQKELVLTWKGGGLKISAPLTNAAQDAMLAEEL